MKNLPTFTLIHSKVPGVAGSKAMLPDQLTGINASKTLRQGLGRTAHLLGGEAREQLTRELSGKSRAKTIGVWDMGAWVGGLPAVIETLNAAQPVITFFEIQAAVPAGLVSSPEKLMKFAERRLRRKLTTFEKHSAGNAILDDDFFPRADAVRRDLGIDCVVALTPAKLAALYKPEDEPRTIYYDFFSSSDDHNSIVSVDGLRKLADRAGRPYEMAVGYLFVAATLAGIGGTQIDFHDDDRGCLFDFNEQRGTLVPGLRTPAIEPDCLKKISAKYRDAATAMIDALATYQPPSPAE
ncbi:MAG: hypothetical protein ABJE47_23735 [bacterium]